MPTFDEKIITLEANAERFNTVINGNVNTTITTSEGGTIKSLLKFFHDVENTLTQKYTALGNITGAISLDVSEFQNYSGTLTGNITLSFTGLPVTDTFLSVSLYIKQDVIGGKVVTFPASVKWDSGVAPNPIINPNVDYLYNFISFDRGVTWLGFLVGYDFS